MNRFKLKIFFTPNKQGEVEANEFMPIHGVQSFHYISDADDMGVVCGFLNTFSSITWFVPDLLDAISEGEFYNDEERITFEKVKQVD